MASVQELIAAAEIQKSPFISMLEGAAGGYYNAQQRRPENDLRRVQMMAQMQEMEQKKQEMEWQKMLNAAAEQNLKNNLSAAAPDNGGPLPTQKLKSVYEYGAKGASLKLVEPANTLRKQFRPQEYYDEKSGKSRIGSFDEESGAIIRKPTDAMAVPPRPSSSGVRSLITLNDKAGKQALAWYLVKYPEKAETDPISGRIVRNYVSSEDYNSEEFQRFKQQAENMLTGGQSSTNTGTENGNKPVYATNPKTGERIVSYDNGNTWTRVK